MKCSACGETIPPTADHYRDHKKRLICKACYVKWLEAKRG